MKKLRENIALIIIIAVAAFFRLYGLNWDQGFHLHPDERAIIMFTLPLNLPSSFAEFLSPTSSLNPHFFAYGSLPIYLLKIISLILAPFSPIFSTYDYINLVGRFISAFFDIGTIFIIFFLGKKIFSKNIGLVAAFFYTISVFPIQTSHFYAVDIPLTFFTLLTLYTLIHFYEKPTIKKAIVVGIFFAASLATKTSAFVLVISIGLSLVADFILIFIKNPHRPFILFSHIPKIVKALFAYGSIIAICTIVFSFIFEPYAFLDFKEFYRQTLEQSQMTHDAFTFPYTLQYVYKTPYFYELKNIFLWGQGPILATISFSGIFYGIFLVIKKNKKTKWAQELILLVFFLSYFAVVGKFAVGWMRYMLPLYPLFCLFGSAFALKIIAPKINFYRPLSSLIFIFLFLILITWPIAFMNIYKKANTRVLATDWINKNIPIGSSIAIEHWDDSLPLVGQQNYRMITLPLYDPDTEYKWESINQQLSGVNYIIIASNRLYEPLMKLTECKKLPERSCYKDTSMYYKKLFDGSLGFKKIAEFSNYPTIPLLNIKIDDSSSDESFTVYDHPKVMIFKKIP